MVEVDTAEHGKDVDGEAALQTWAADKNCILPETLEALSPSNSRHRFFRHPGSGIEIKTCAGVLPGVDVRGDKGMVLSKNATIAERMEHEALIERHNKHLRTLRRAREVLERTREVITWRGKKIPLGHHEEREPKHRWEKEKHRWDHKPWQWGDN